MTALLLCLLLPAGPPSFWKQVKLFLFDRTFENVYQPNAFDVAILTPYFLVLAVLSVYGMHRYLAGVQLFFGIAAGVPGRHLVVGNGCLASRSSCRCTTNVSWWSA